MVHTHGRMAQQLAAYTRGIPPEQLIAVAIDVGKNTAMAMACDFAWQVLVPPFAFEMNRDGVAKIIDRVTQALPARVQLVRVGIETAGHYHRPLTTPGALPERWQVVELNPAHVALQRRANGARAVKTDPVDLVTICDMLVAGRGWLVSQPSAALTGLTAWVAHRRRRIDARTATKNQLQTQVDRTFPGLSGALHSVLDTKVAPAGDRPGSPTRPGWPGWAPPGSAPLLPGAASKWRPRSQNDWWLRLVWRCLPLTL